MSGRASMRLGLLGLAVGFAMVSTTALAADAGAVHERILTLDTHMDTPMNLARPGWDIMDAHSVEADVSQVDYPRMVKGGLDGGFFAIYTPQGPRTPQGFAAARDAALKRGVEIREMVARHGDKFELALRAGDAARIARSGKRIVFMSIENSYPLGTDLSLLDTFYKLGVRLAGPVHSTNNQFADSATDTPRWHGLSKLGRAWVAKMNYYTDRDVERKTPEECAAVRFTPRLFLRRFFRDFVSLYVRRQGYRDGAHGLAACFLHAVYPAVETIKTWERQWKEGAGYRVSGVGSGPALPDTRSTRCAGTRTPDTPEEAE